MDKAYAVLVLAVTLVAVYAQNTTVVTLAPPVTTSNGTIPTDVPIQPPVPDTGDAPVNTYTVSAGKTGEVCIVASMAVKLSFNYTKNSTNENMTIHWNLPHNTSTTSDSMCGSDKQVLSLSFFDDWRLNFYFNKTSDGSYAINETKLEFLPSSYRFNDVKEGSDKTVNVMSSDVLFKSKNQTSAKCNSSQELKGFNQAENITVYLLSVDTKDVLLQAFKTDNKTSTSTSYSECPADASVSNIVPIAVGAALAGLVLIVLIAYLIGRSRNSHGYESV